MFHRGALAVTGKVTVRTALEVSYWAPVLSLSTRNGKSTSRKNNFGLDLITILSSPTSRNRLREHFCKKCRNQNDSTRGSLGHSIYRGILPVVILDKKSLA